jgi:hypothetical protein
MSQTTTEKLYYVLYTYPGQNHVNVMHGANDKVIVAKEGSKHLIEGIAKQLVADNMFGQAQLVCTESSLMLSKEDVHELDVRKVV